MPRILTEKERKLDRRVEVTSNIQVGIVFTLVISICIFIYRYFALSTFATASDPTGNFQSVLGFIQITIVVIASIFQYFFRRAFIEEILKTKEVWRKDTWVKREKTPRKEYFYFLVFSFLMFILDWYSLWTFALLSALCATSLILTAVWQNRSRLFNIFIGPLGRYENDEQQKFPGPY